MSYQNYSWKRAEAAEREAVQSPATPQEPSGAQLALADIEKAYSETEVALAQVVSRNDKELFFNGDKALRSHLKKNLDYYRIRRDGVRALLASAPPAVWQDIETACETALRLDLPTRELVARIRSLRPSPPTPGGK